MAVDEGEQNNQGGSLTVPQVAALLGVNERTVRKWTGPNGPFAGRSEREVRNGREVDTIGPALLADMRAAREQREQGQAERPEGSERTAETRRPSARPVPSDGVARPAVVRSEYVGPSVLDGPGRNGYHPAVEALDLVPFDSAPVADVRDVLIEQQRAEIARLLVSLAREEGKADSWQKQAENRESDAETWKKLAVDSARDLKEAKGQIDALRAVPQLEPVNPVNSSIEPDPPAAPKKKEGFGASSRAGNKQVTARFRHVH